MSPRDFGIYGLIASASYVIAQIAGIEAYQIVMRRISQATPEDFIEDRPFYGRMLFLTGSIAASFGTALGLYFSWSPIIVAMCAGIVTLEYLGVEAQRVLIAERQYNRAMAQVSMRFLPWSVAFPLLTLLGTIEPTWSIETVLGSWLFFSAISIFLATPVLPLYFAKLPEGFKCWLTQIFRAAPPWMIVALSGRFLESGSRMVPGFVINENAAGRFVFLASISTIGAVAIRSAVEPMFFTRMIARDGADKARRAFTIVSLAVLAVAAVLGGVAWYFVGKFAVHAYTPEETKAFFMMEIASALFVLSQVPHFKLYAAKRDREILWIAVLTLAVALPLTVAATWMWGILGTALGTLIGSTFLLVVKLERADMWHSAKPFRLQY